MQGKIIKALAGFYYVESNGQIYQTRARGNFRKKGQTPYVGDEVEFSAEKDSENYINPQRFPGEDLIYYIDLRVPRDEVQRGYQDGVQVQDGAQN